MRRLWLTWSWRDLRSRPVQVVVIALVIAIGTGVATGLSSLQSWRTMSNDASFAALRYHDVRATLPEGGFAREGSLERALSDVGAVADAREQLVLPTQVDASHGGRAVLVPGRIIGQRVDPRPVVDGLAADAGRVLLPGDEGEPVAMLDRSFAAQRELPEAMTIRLAGGRELRSVGWAFQPQFLISAEGGLMAGATAGGFALVFTSLATAQQLAGREGEVNQVVVRGREGVPAAEVERQVSAALESALPRTGITYTRGLDEPAAHVLYKDAEGDQKIWRTLSLLVLVGAALAAYNLTSRTVESQRREIGIGMALGVPPRRLALRPLLMGIEIAVLGAAFGVVAGLALSRMFRSLLESTLPLPELVTPFRTGQFVIWALVGVALPLLGVLLPVWKAVRMTPIEAIRIGFRAAAGGGLAPLLARLRVPGGSLVQMPIRNVVRAPRRTLVTVLGIGIIISLVVSFSGLIDSFLRPIDTARAEATRGGPDRMAVSFETFLRADGKVVRGVERNRAVGSARRQNVLAVTLEQNGEDIDGVMTTFDHRRPGWQPSMRAGGWGSGVLLARQAALDLGVGVGDRVVVRHPLVTGPGEVRIVRSRVRVDGLHGSTLRTLVYGASGDWDRRTGLAGLANQVEVAPAPGGTRDSVARALFGREGVASVQSAVAPFEDMDETMDRFLVFIYAVQGFILVVALLVAFNSAAISADERRREHATMLAYGIPQRTVLLQGVAESGILGVMASITGIAIGLVIVRWIVESVVPQTLPDIELAVSLSSTTLVVAAAIGVGACALAPLLTGRALRRMDVASTLRVME